MHIADDNDANLFIDKLVNLLDRFAEEVWWERFKLHRQLSAILQVGCSLKINRMKSIRTKRDALIKETSQECKFARASQYYTLFSEPFPQQQL